MADKPPLVIYKFFTKYVQQMESKGDGRVTAKNGGAKVPMDMVEYGPIGAAGRTQVVERIDVISKIRQDSQSNPAVAQSQAIWDFIKPRYDAWKAGQELPEIGTPLSSWNALSNEQIDVLKVNGIKTVEDMAGLTDIHIQRVPIPNMRTLIQEAKSFLENQDTNKAAAERLADKQTIANLTAKIDQLASMVAGKMEETSEPVAIPVPAKRKPGRPRKDAQPQAA